MNILVTGASGFIGAAFVRHLLQEHGTEFNKLVCFIRNTNPKNLKRLYDWPVFHQLEGAGKVAMIYGDLLHDISGLCENIHTVVHFAAKTFVDHSIKDPEIFVKTNVVGTFKLLEDARRYGVQKFIQAGTDEVYGSIEEGEFTEDSPLRPGNPYSASKAGADALAISYANTYGLNTLITRTENNYGFYQHPQKALPAWITRAIRGENIPIYGDGSHVRQWLWVEDNVSAIWGLVKAHTVPGDVYNISGGQEMTNLAMARRILKLTNRSEDLIVHLDENKTRPGQDRRYALNGDKLAAKTGYRPKVSLDDGLKRLVWWHMDNKWWS